jgi:hypothetical protein
MKPLAECMIGPPNLTTLPGVRPLGDLLIPAGAAKAALIYDGTLNRAGIIETGVFSDYNRCNPPDTAALAIVAAQLRNPAKHGMGAGPIHAFTDWENGQTRADVVAAVRFLRTKLAPTALLSIGDYPFAWDPTDPAWDEAAALTTALTWDLYPWNNVGLGGLEAWLSAVDDAERKLRAWFPRRRKWVAWLTPTFAVYWQDKPEYAGIVHLDGQPVPLGWWRAVLERIKAGGWQPLMWWLGDDVGPVREHVDVFADVWGLSRTVPAVAVA